MTCNAVAAALRLMTHGRCIRLIKSELIDALVVGLCMLAYMQSERHSCACFHVSSLMCFQACVNCPTVYNHAFMLQSTVHACAHVCWQAHVIACMTASMLCAWYAHACRLTRVQSASTFGCAFACVRAGIRIDTHAQAAKPCLHADADAADAAYLEMLVLNDTPIIVESQSNQVCLRPCWRRCWLQQKRYRVRRACTVMFPEQAVVTSGRNH